MVCKRGVQQPLSLRLTEVTKQEATCRVVILRSVSLKRESSWFQFHHMEKNAHNQKGRSWVSFKILCENP